MKIIMNGKDITETLVEFDGEYVRLECKSYDKEHTHIIFGTIMAETGQRQDKPYNPLMDIDCGTDAILGRR